MSDNGNWWRIEQHAQLTAGVRSALNTKYGVTLDPSHTYAAIVQIMEEAIGGERCLIEFPYSFVLAGSLGGNIENAIDAECRTRITAAKNARPLIEIAKAKHPL